jgi:hypothetical protein
MHAVVPLLFLAVIATSAHAALDVPKRKSGLWEIRTERIGGPPQAPATPGPMLMCIDEKTDDLSRQIGESAAKEMCSKTDLRRDGDRLVADSVCKFGATTATTQTVMSGRFDAAYDADVRTRYEPPLMGMSESRAVIKARWLGPCKPGQRPGDMVLPDGMTINVFDAEKSRPSK